MTDSTVRRGNDTHVSEGFPTTENGDAKYPKVDATAAQRRRTLLYFPLPSIAGRTVLSATLTGRVRGSGASQTVTATRLASAWAAATANWNNQPATTGSGSSVVTGAVVDGSLVSIDVTTMLQAVANGGKWYGFQLITTATTSLLFYGFNSGQDSWTLTYELSDAPEQPTMLSPSGGVVSKTKPTVSWDFTDFGGSTEQAGLQVQVDPSGALLSNFLSEAASNMESGISAWTAAGTPLPALSQSAVRAFEGTQSLLITFAGSGGFPQAQATVSGLTIGQTYTAIFPVYVPTGDAGVIPVFATATGSTVTLKDQWTLATVTFTATATSHSVAIRGSGSAVGDLCWVDRVRVVLGSVANPVFDSGQIPGTDPELDLNTVVPPFAGFSTPGGTDQWRVRVKDGAGLWSSWSDWAPWIYQAKPTLVMDSPVASSLTDPSPTILAHISSGTLAAYRIRIASGTDKTRIRYDSGKRNGSGTSLAHTIPFKNSDDVRVFHEDVSYWLNVRVWDTYDREATVGDPPYIETWVLVTFSDSATTAPILTSVSQPGLLPKPRLVWTMGSAPDNWVILKDGKRVARLDPADVSSGGGTYTWDSADYTEAFESHTWRVKAIVAGVQGPQSNGIAFTPTLSGVWLVDDATGNGVKLRGTATEDWQRLDRSVVYKPIRRQSSVIVVDGQEGLSGSYSGMLRDETGLTRATALARLESMKDNPTTPVWLLAAELAIKVRLMNLSWSPHSETTPSVLRSKVSFSFEQSSGFTYGVS